MKFRADAVNSQGNVVRLVLRAESEDDARTMLLEEEIFPKRVEPADEDDKVTWVPRRRVEKRLAEARGETSAGDASGPAPDAPRTATLMREGQQTSRGLLIVEPGRVWFQGREGRAEPRLIEPPRVERAVIRGFPGRLLSISLIDGTLIEMSAGFILAGRLFRQAARILSGGDAKK